MLKRFRAAAALLLLAVAGSCGDPTFSGDEGIFSFRYSGEIDGTFSAGGMEPTHFARGSYVVGVSADGAVRRDGVWYSAFVAAPTSIPGRYPFIPGVPGATPANASGRFTIERPEDTFPEPYVFVSGTLEITHVSEERVRGRFSGTAQRGSATLRIADGSFDVPVIIGPGT